MSYEGIARSAVAVATIFCMLALSFQVPAAAKGAAADDEYHRLLPRGMDTFMSAMTWARTGKNTAVVFAVDRPDDNDSVNRLISFRTTSTGKTRASKTFMGGIEGRFVFADAISFAAPGADAPASKPGLLFLAYYKNAAPTKMIFAVAPFDAKGKRTAAFRVLKTIEVAWYLRFADTVIFARAVGERVGVSLSTAMTPSMSSAILESQAYFLETDIAGVPTRGPRAVNLPNGGKLMKFLSMRPAYKYNRWFVPCQRVDVKHVASAPNGNTEPVGSALMVYYAKPMANGFAMKLREVESDDQADAAGAYAGVQFLPEVEGGSIAPARNGLRLFYQKRSYTEAAGPAAEQSPLDYTGKYYTRVVKKTAKALKAKHLPSPEWDPELQSEPGDINSDSEEVISEAVVTSDGRIVIGMSRYQEIIRAAGPASEGNVVTTGEFMAFAVTMIGLVYIAAMATPPDLSLHQCYYTKMLVLGGWAAFLMMGRLIGLAYALAMFVTFMQV